MKYKMLLAIAMALFLLLPAIIALPAGVVLAQEADSNTIRIEVSHHGFNNTPGDFRVEVEAGHEVVITFVYGDTDLSENNPHTIFISGYNIQTEPIDRNNPETTVRFTPTGPGEVNFTCTEYCLGHENLQKGHIVILPSSKTATGEPGGSLLLTTVQQGETGQPLALTAAVRDVEGKPVSNATVKFFIGADFFTHGLMEIGEAITNGEGVATIDYTPRLAGDIQVTARYESIEGITTVAVADTGKIYYRTEAGIRLPAPGKEVFIGPESAVNPGDNSPTSALRLPGGILSWLLLPVLAVIVLWFTYFRVAYQVFRIPIRGKMGHAHTKIVPSVGLAIIFALGVLLVLMLITGPYSFPNLSH